MKAQVEDIPKVKVQKRETGGRYKKNGLVIDGGRANLTTNETSVVTGAL